jgi:Cu+-exporting ATPase
MKKKTFDVKGMHCASCAMVITGELEDVGVKASCSYVKQTLEVEFDEKAVSEEKIASVVSQAGYSIISQE